PRPRTFPLLSDKNRESHLDFPDDAPREGMRVLKSIPGLAEHRIFTPIQQRSESLDDNIAEETRGVRVTIEPEQGQVQARAHFVNDQEPAVSALGACLVEFLNGPPHYELDREGAVAAVFDRERFVDDDFAVRRDVQNWRNLPIPLQHKCP